MAAKKASASQQKAERTAELRAFVAEHPDGWNHHEWTELLDRLRERGHETGDADSIGAELELERLSSSLAGLSGVGPRRVEALARHFGTLWALRHASPEEIAAVPGIPRALAERISSSVT